MKFLEAVVQALVDIVTVALRDRVREQFWIVMGEDFVHSSLLDAPLLDVVREVLAATHNSARPPEHWEARDMRGTLLDKRRTLREFIDSNHSCERLFLSVGIGAGGHVPTRPAISPAGK